MRDMKAQRMEVELHSPQGERKSVLPVEVFREAVHSGADMSTRVVQCLHCGKKHLFPKESFKRLWWDPMQEYFSVHFECPHGDCDGWLADFMEPEDQY